MELTRRDAVAALGAIGIGAGGIAVYTSDRWRDEAPIEEHEVEAARAVAEVLYPSEVEVTDEFVETYVLGRREDDEEYVEGMTTALEALDGHAEAEYGTTFASVTVQQRDDLLRSLGLDRAAPAPEGNEIERIRYYVVNDLLYALFTTPTGGELVGSENPPGHPGGLAAYQRGP